MIRYRSDLIDLQKSNLNYALKKHADIDLSLVTSPYVWNIDIESVINAKKPEVLGKYGKPFGNSEFIERLSDHEGLPPGWIMIVPGADFAIEVICKQFLGDKSEACIIIPTFPRFEIVISAMENVDITYAVDIQSIDKNYNLVLLCSPNNPTTNQIDVASLKTALAKCKNTLFCVDAVLGVYGDVDFTSIAMEYDNLVVIKSFSKLGLAGLRLGYIIGNPDIIKYMQTALSPFAVPDLMQLIGLSILNDYERVELIHTQLDASWKQIEREWRGRLIRNSRVPFYLLQINGEANDAANKLYEKRISVVSGQFFRGLGSKYLRIALGTKQENERLVQAVNECRLI
ncbi:MAG: aminotransferase class I/II-fold pyridoxal phosphate-dependent enzyme [Candidatus Thiodiazotropha sp.]|jgi:histidinol-phosphate aminotransferase